MILAHCAASFGGWGGAAWFRLLRLINHSAPVRLKLREKRKTRLNVSVLS
jgi:hypothetical protein